MAAGRYTDEMVVREDFEVAGGHTGVFVRVSIDLLVSMDPPRNSHVSNRLYSLVGIVYKTWITPVEDSPLFNTRTGIGPWSDRVGALAYALTPFTILLSNRESVLSLLTGIPYQHFNFLHRWTGRIIFAQSFLHTLGWTIVEGRLYQPQPDEYVSYMKQMYAIFGVVAMFLLTLMLVLSSKTAIRWFGYEFFKITHWILAVLYIAACWGHWDRLWCWVVASLALMVIDQVLRGMRTCYIHFGGSKGKGLGFRCAHATVKVLGKGDDIVVRLDFDYDHREPWKPGQHFCLCFPSLSTWQSHPFTPSSTPELKSGVQHHTYLIRVRQGQTSQLVTESTIPVILTGPYGNEHPKYETRNVLAVAGGTGVSFTLPIALAGLKQLMIPRAAVDFVWIVRRAEDLEWLATELSELRELLKTCPSLRVSIFVTRETNGNAMSKTAHSSDDEKGASVLTSSKASSSSQSSNENDLTSATDRFNITYLGDHHPAMSEIVGDFMDRAEALGGNIEIVASGPEAMGSDLRSAVAAVGTREHLDFYWDSRE